MNQLNKKAVFRRILIALDASHHSLAALRAAVELAAGMKAELIGLYVEDVNLVRAAQSTAAHEVRYPFVAAGKLSPDRMQRQLRAQATQSQRALARMCNRYQVKWSFQVTRGEVAHEVMTAAQQVDLLILGKAGRPLIQKDRLGSTALTAAVQAPCCVLVLQRDRRLMPPVMVTYDGSPSARKALHIAARLARKNGGYLIVAVVAATAEEEYRLQADTADWLRRQGLLVRYTRLRQANAGALVQALHAENNGALVLNGSLLHAAEIHKLLDRTDCPILMVR